MPKMRSEVREYTERIGTRISGTTGDELVQALITAGILASAGTEVVHDWDSVSQAVVEAMRAVHLRVVDWSNVFVQRHLPEVLSVMLTQCCKCRRIAKMKEGAAESGEDGLDVIPTPGDARKFAESLPLEGLDDLLGEDEEE
jgi:hypothetical protein